MADWSPKELDTLRYYLAEGLSASQIAAHLRGRSRNSVIGKVHRLKLAFAQPTLRPARGGETGARSSCARREPAGVDRRHAAPAGGFFSRSQPNAPEPRSSVAPARKTDPTAANLSVAAPISFLEAVEHGRCPFFIGDPLAMSGPAMPVCGAERTRLGRPGTRYCARHERGQWQPRAAS